MIYLKNIIKIIYNYWFILSFFIVLFYAFYGSIIDERLELNGVVQDIDKIECTIDTVMEGEFQSYLNDIWDRGFPGKNFLIRVRNQLIYSVLRQSPNANYVMGKDAYLFEPSYINFELGLNTSISDEYCDETIEKIVKLRRLLSENGKELYFFITPSKADFKKDKIPWYYNIMEIENNNSGRLTHQKHIDIYEKSGAKYFDAVNWIKENSKFHEAPVFYKSGIHWNNVWGETAASELINYISETSQYNLDVLSVKEKRIEEPIWPSTDLYSNMNLLLLPNEEWWNTEVEIVDKGKDNPNVFMRGGSFMGQSLSKMIRSGVFKKDVYLENYYYFTDKYTTQTLLTSYTSYDEMPLDTMLGETDIIIIEVNDTQVGSISFGFIDYLLEHGEYLDRKY